MRAVWLAAAGLTLAVSAWAQNAPIQATPLPPLQQQWQQQEGAPPEAQPPASPNDPGPGVQGQASPTAPASPPATFDRPNVWVPAGAVKLQALDKVNAQATALTIKVGQSATFGSLTITAKACVVRPPDQPADAAAYLDVTDSHPDSPGFDGWMLADEPSVSMMQHPIYDLRVTGCT
ncbi:MAG: DUF2155 domain-containing protein [Rhodopila sp.]|nr:DUF2155 domain-containing protein [Rhodopila sp.]